MFLRLLGICTLTGVLITLSVLSTHLPRTRAAWSQQKASPAAIRNERKLNKTDWPNMPVKVNKAKLKRGLAAFGQSFTDTDDDWLEGFTLNVQNTSHKTIVFIDVSLTFFEKDEGLVPGRTPVGFPFSYGSESGVFESSSPFRPVPPGASVDVVLSADEFSRLKTLLLDDNYPIKFHHVDVRIDKVVFADGQVWYKSYLFYRDPNNPDRFIRDKEFKKGAKYEEIEPGTILSANPALPAEEQFACRAPQPRGFFLV
jgi:hypothetical protein